MRTRLINGLFWAGFLIAVFLVIKNHVSNTQSRLDTAVAQAAHAYAQSLHPYSRYFRQLPATPELAALARESNQLKTKFIVPPYDPEAMRAAHAAYKTLYTHAMGTPIHEALGLLLPMTDFHAEHYAATVALQRAFEQSVIHRLFII